MPYPRELAIEPISRVRSSPQVEFEERMDALLQRRDNSFEMFRALVCVYGLTTQKFSRTFFGMSKSEQDAMHQKILESTVLGDNFAGRSWRAGFAGAFFQGLSAVPALAVAQAPAAMLNAYKDYESNKWQLEKAYKDHQYQTQRTLEETSRTANDRIRTAVAQALNLIQKLDQERSTTVTTLNRS